LWEAAKAGNLKAVPRLGFCHLGLWQMDASKTWLFHDPATTETETSEIKQKMVCKKNSRTPRNKIIHDSIVYTWIPSL